MLFSWTSCYLGGHVGGAWVDHEMTGTFPVPIPGPFGFITPVPVASTLPIDFGSSGVLVGGQVGCNYQFASRWVIGFEGDFSWANVSGTTQQTNGVTFTAPILLLPTFVSATGTLSAKTDFIGTATARFGYALGPIGQGLIYGKGGAAWVANRYNFNGQVQTTVCTTVQAAQCATVAPFSPIFNWDGRETRVASQDAAISGVMPGTGASLDGLDALADAPPRTRPSRNTLAVISFLFMVGSLGCRSLSLATPPQAAG